MTNEEIVLLADLMLKVDNGEVPQKILDEALEKIALAQDFTALQLAYNVFSRRPYGVLFDNPITLGRAQDMGEYLNAQSEAKRVAIGDDEFLDMLIFYPPSVHIRGSASQHYKDIVVEREGLPTLRGTRMVRGGLVTVTSEDGRQKITQAGGSPPDTLARMLLIELENERLAQSR
jgi:hypothetical protein